MPPESTEPTKTAQDTAPDWRRILVRARRAHWRRTRRLTALLLALWLGTTFGSVFFARQLAGLSLFGWPLSFYLAAQGAALIYLGIIALYAWRLRRYDLAFARQLKGAA